MEISIRKIEEGDIPALAEIEAKSFSRPWSVADFQELFSLSYATYLVAVLDGKVVGSAGMRTLCGEGNIDNVVVDEAYRGHGIAQKLIAALIEVGTQELGADAFTLEVRVSNAPAIRAYEKNGFVSEGVRPHFYEDPTEDALIMWRR